MFCKFLGVVGGALRPDRAEDIEKSQDRSCLYTFDNTRTKLSQYSC